jgi:uncharacterized NTF2-like protein DUF6841
MAPDVYGPRSSLRCVNVADIRAWFDQYLAAFAACGRGESDDLATLLRYYAVPLVLSTDEAAVALTSKAQVLNALGGQIEGMRAAGYDRSETLDSEVIAINATSALHTAEFSRRRPDGGEIGRLRATYLITDGTDGRRIAALAVHGR